MSGLLCAIDCSCKVKECCSLVPATQLLLQVQCLSSDVWVSIWLSC